MADRIGRLFDNVNDRSDAFLDMVRAGNERTYRFSKIFVEEAQRTQRESADLAQMWLRSPLDVINLTNETLATWTRRQRRRMELGRTFFSELGVARDETRDIVERVTAANRETARVSVNAGKEAVSRVAEEISERAEDVSETMSDVARSASRRSSN